MTSLNAAGHARPPGSFVGRELELAELRAGLTDAATGHGHLFLLSGEPGIGKTRLADDPCATSCHHQMSTPRRLDAGVPQRPRLAPNGHASLLKLPPPQIFFYAATPAPGLRPLIG